MAVWPHHVCERLVLLSGPLSALSLRLSDRASLGHRHCTRERTTSTRRCRQILFGAVLMAMVLRRRCCRSERQEVRQHLQDDRHLWQRSGRLLAQAGQVRAVLLLLGCLCLCARASCSSCAGPCLLIDFSAHAHTHAHHLQSVTAGQTAATRLSIPSHTQGGAHSQLQPQPLPGRHLQPRDVGVRHLPPAHLQARPLSPLCAAQQTLHCRLLCCRCAMTGRARMQQINARGACIKLRLCVQGRPCQGDQGRLVAVFLFHQVPCSPLCSPLCSPRICMRHCSLGAYLPAMSTCTGLATAKGLSCRHLYASLHTAPSPLACSTYKA